MCVSLSASHGRHSRNAQRWQSDRAESRIITNPCFDGESQQAPLDVAPVPNGEVGSSSTKGSLAVSVTATAVAHRELRSDLASDLDKHSAGHLHLLLPCASSKEPSQDMRVVLGSVMSRIQTFRRSQATAHMPRSAQCE